MRARTHAQHINHSENMIIVCMSLNKITTQLARHFNGNPSVQAFKETELSLNMKRVSRIKGHHGSVQREATVPSRTSVYRQVLLLE